MGAAPALPLRVQGGGACWPRTLMPAGSLWHHTGCGGSELCNKGMPGFTPECLGLSMQVLLF